LNPVSGRVLKHVANGGTGPDRTGPAADRDGMPALACRVMITIRAFRRRPVREVATVCHRIRDHCTYS
jgi:hypothetical protein